MEAALRRWGTPLFVLDGDRAVRAADELMRHLPRVAHHYAVKALSHPVLLSRLARAGMGFDIASNAELDAALAAGASPERIIHTHPHKKAADIAYAMSHGIRTFVVDNLGEVDKLERFPSAEALVRLAFPDPANPIDLSAKFGLGIDAAPGLLAYARRRRVPVRGLSFHVGSQSENTGAFSRAVGAAIDLVDRLRADAHPIRSVDIGGGFPVTYRRVAPELDAIAEVLNPVIESRTDIEFLSEPGRFVAAPSMTLIAGVVSVSTRPDGREWAFIDDGVYGGYSNVLFDHVDPVIITTSHRELRRQTIAGPTCDSIDVVARDRLLPRLAVGDLVVSPMMGAYTAVSATDFHGFRRAPIVVL